MSKSVNSYLESLTPLEESWAYFSRTIHVHKLNPPKGDHTIDSLNALVKARVLDNIKDVYIYSFIHPDSNSVSSLTGSRMLKPNQEFKTWYTYVNPLRGLLYKGQNSEGGGDVFSSERIGEDTFRSQSFLFTGEANSFKKVAEIPCEAISTTVPIVTIPINMIYENIKFRCKPNKYNLENIQFKRFKVITLPQIVLKSNYMFVYKCSTYSKG